jgi:hypothetical protein
MAQMLKGALYNVAASFDAQKVERAVTRATLGALKRVGGRIRLTGRRSIRRREGPSRPGRPPHTQTGFLKDDILYRLDAPVESVVAGPWRSPWLNMLHEFGGRGKRTPSHGGGWGSYPARPFMGPALEKNIDHIPDEWRDTVHE